MKLFSNKLIWAGILLTLTIVFVIVYAQNQIIPSRIPSTFTQDDRTNPSSYYHVVAQGLDTPWAIAILPDESLLVTERKGTVRYIGSSGTLEQSPVGTILQAKEIGEGGLLGMALHPDFTKNHYIYFYYTYQGMGANTLNRVVRMTYDNQKLSNEKVIVDKIPGASNHNGGRIHFGPDGFLYIATGDAQEPSQAQDTKSLAGKILRVTADGKPVVDNPFGNEVYSYGHRNVQGLAWDGDGKLWATEHGRSGIQSGLDEINMIEKGKNYGWPDIQGDERRNGMETAKINSGNNTWAPAGIAIFNDRVLFGGLRGQALYEVKTNNGQVADHFKEQYGRIREVLLGPDNMLYISTSNQDGRGKPQVDDDKIIKIDLERL